MLGQQKAFEKTEISFVERLAQQLGITANAKYIYADPIERDGVTIVPVAKAVYGFGGGSGKKEKDEGFGGGGGAVLTPVGYIEIKDGATRFRPLRDPVVYASMLAAVAPLVIFTVWRLTKAFRKEK
jgi:uncharacterized spore protein YtfJ